MANTEGSDSVSRSRMLNDSAEFIDRIIEIRKSKGISREMLAKRSGISERAIQNWEQYRSAVKPGYEKRIFMALDVTPDEFFGYENSDTMTLHQLLMLDRATLRKLYEDVVALKGALEYILAEDRQGASDVLNYLLLRNRDAEINGPDENPSSGT